MKSNYKCKDNDVKLQFHCKDGKIDEVWVQVDGEKSWTVVGYEDLLKGIKKAEKKAESQLKNCFIHDVSDSLRYSEREVDFAYLCGVFNTSGIDGLHTEIQRLKELGKEPHDIIEACRKQ